MSINLTDEIEVKTKKGKLGAAKQIFLEGDTQTVEKEIQDINARHNSLNTKHESLNRTVQGIAVTGGASTATNVTYNNDSSGLNAENAQDAIDELQDSKINKTSILQESGNAEDKVMSQKATSVELNKKADKEETNSLLAEKANTADVDTKFTEEKNRVDGELAKKFDKVSVIQESGNAEDKVMSQKATSTAIADETTRAKAAEQAILFDVSAHNNGAVFESISALLGDANLSTLIPTSARHGGMTIRFIKGSKQSYDNKYVQYRYLETDASVVAKFTDTNNWQKFPSIDNVEGPFTYAISDNEDKILSYIDKDGYTHDKRVEAEDVTKFMEKIDSFYEFQFGVIDGEDKVIFGLKNDGSIFSPWLDNQLKEADQKASKIQNYTSVKSARLPIPHNIAQINVIEGFNESALGTITWTFEYFDEYGNYFMKNASVKVQGRSSVVYPKHNWGLDLLNDDGSKFKLKLGNWLEMDSFHLKAYYIDVFVGQCDVAYKLMEDVYQSAQQKYKRPWGYLIDKDVTTTGASGNFDNDFNYTEPLAHPDGFPVKLYVNGEFYGVYAFNLKKDRNNYKMNKNNTSHILLDGVTDKRYMFTTNVGWSQLEVRNPKGLKDVNGNDYEEGAELSGTDDKSAIVKASIERLNGFITVIKAETTKAVFEQYWNVPLMIDHYLVSQVIANFDDVQTHTNSVWVTYDGNIWSPTLYDCDSIFGQNANGTSISNPPVTLYSATDVNQPYYYLVKLYRTELEARYKELRDKGIFTTEHISGILQEWVGRIGNENIKLNLDKWSEIPTYRASGTYTKNPKTGGCYNSVSRVEKWLASSIAIVDGLLNYNN